jgi:hypothetical protein
MPKGPDAMKMLNHGQLNYSQVKEKRENIVLVLKSSILKKKSTNL